MSSENTIGFLNILGNTFRDIINENYNIVNDTAATDYANLKIIVKIYLSI